MEIGAVVVGTNQGTLGVLSVSAGRSVFRAAAVARAAGLMFVIRDPTV